MLLVADGGSAVTDWILLLPNDEELSFSSRGMNPFFLSEKEMAKVLNSIKTLENYEELITEVHFFGAGCNSPDRREIVSNALSVKFKNAFINVENDWLGSAYATCKDSPGLNCILGTGSNISYYDGYTLHEGVHSLGYIFDDEGAGTAFGKKMITDYLYHKMPEELSKKFAMQFNVTKESVIENLYQKPLPNFYLASHSAFLVENKEHPYCHEIIATELENFIITHIFPYENYQNTTCHFVGPIAYNFRHILTRACEKHGVKLGVILESPIQELFNYVKQKEGFEKMLS